MCDFYSSCQLESASKSLPHRVLPPFTVPTRGVGWASAPHSHPPGTAAPSAPRAAGPARRSRRRPQLKTWRVHKGFRIGSVSAAPEPRTVHQFKNTPKHLIPSTTLVPLPAAEPHYACPLSKVPPSATRLAPLSHRTKPKRRSAAARACTVAPPTVTRCSSREAETAPSH